MNTIFHGRTVKEVITRTISPGPRDHTSSLPPWCWSAFHDTVLSLHPLCCWNQTPANTEEFFLDESPERISSNLICSYHSLLLLFLAVILQNFFLSSIVKILETLHSQNSFKLIFLVLKLSKFLQRTCTGISYLPCSRLHVLISLVRYSKFPSLAKGLKHSIPSLPYLLQC